MDRYFFYRNIRISYTDSGSGNPILLIHGYLESKSIWGLFGRELSLTHRVIAIDLPGHGGSDLADDVQGMELMADIIKDLLHFLKIEKVFICGHSLGGYIALAFADLYPDMLHGYSLFHSHPFADTPEALEKRKREISLVEAGKKALMYPENVKRMYADENLEKMKDELYKSKEIAASLTDKGIIAVLKGMMARPSRLHVMERGAVPCLWILGALDNYIPSDKMRIRVNLPEGSVLSVLQNSGHMGFIEDKDEALRIIRSFYDEHNG